MFSKIGENNLKIREINQAERPRERVWRDGVSALSNAELMAIIIKTGCSNYSALEIAHKVLGLGDDGLAGLAQLELEELQQVEGIGPAKATEILATVELGRRVVCAGSISSGRISSVRDVVRYFMDDMKHLKKEHFRAVLLSTSGDIIGIEDISIGNLTSSIVHPRETFKAAIKRSAASMLLVHNHPSGNPQPSNEDIETTLRLVESGKLLGIEIIDHVIIGDEAYTSMREKNII